MRSHTNDDDQWLAWIELPDRWRSGDRRRVYVQRTHPYLKFGSRGGAARNDSEEAAAHLAQRLAHEGTPFGAEHAPLRAPLRQRPGDMPGH